ncbi:hypothetical protein QTP70_011921 [Hemibagrus guttatus]|uniref:Death domain-containing protein n=1 Tax=Hemibagrus guttatus TaxID=175788 RepID=A0AAE0UHR5_9TELE|nr:hypothetical protein QTP70_011921 [Hemibagrus guttatus]
MIDFQIRDSAQEPCGRLSFTKEPRTYRSLNHNAICNLNITLPVYSKDSDSDQDADEESEKTHEKYEDETESTDFSTLHTHMVHDPATLASPDLLSDVSDMKQDLIKISGFLTKEVSEPSLVDGLKYFVEDEEEPFEIVEKVKEDLEKVEQILGVGNFVKETEKSKCRDKEAAEEKSQVTEPLLREVRITRATDCSSAPQKDASEMVSHLSTDLEHYLQHLPVTAHPAQEENIAEEIFTEVVLPRKCHPPRIKKPARKKLKEREFVSCSSEDELERMSSEESLDGDTLLGDSELEVPPVSPKVVETPIGSIKDRVKALQRKVEEEEKEESVKAREVIRATAVQSKTFLTMKENGEKYTPPPKSPKSPRSQTERIEHSMSVKELMKAFQTGQDPSKGKSGLFEHKVITSLVLTSTDVSEDSKKAQISEINYQNITGQSSPIILDQYQQNKIMISDEIIQEQAQRTSEDTEESNISFRPSRLNSENTLVSVSEELHPAPDHHKLQCGEQGETSNVSSGYEEQSKEEILISEDKIIQNKQCSKVLCQEEIQAKDSAVTVEVWHLEEEECGPEILHYKKLSTSHERRTSEEPQISPNRKPSEDFSAVIKEELEESPEYQLFIQAADPSPITSYSKMHIIQDSNQVEHAAVEHQSYKPKPAVRFATTVVQSEKFIPTVIDNEEMNEKLQRRVQGGGDFTDIMFRSGTPRTSLGEYEAYEEDKETAQTSPENLIESHQKVKSTTEPEYQPEEKRAMQLAYPESGSPTTSANQTRVEETQETDKDTIHSTTFYTEIKSPVQTELEFVQKSPSDIKKEQEISFQIERDHLSQDICSDEVSSVETAEPEELSSRPHVLEDPQPVTISDLNLPEITPDKQELSSHKPLESVQLSSTEIKTFQSELEETLVDETEEVQNVYMTTVEKTTVTETQTHSRAMEGIDCTFESGISVQNLEGSYEAPVPQETKHVGGCNDIFSEVQEIQQMLYSTISTSSPDTFDGLKHVTSDPESGCKSDSPGLSPGKENFCTDLSPDSVQVSSREIKSPIQTERTRLEETEEDHDHEYKTTLGELSLTEIQTEIQTEQEIVVNVGVDSPIQDLQDTHQAYSLKETQQARDIYEISSEEPAESEEHELIQQKLSNVVSLHDLQPVMMSGPESIESGISFQNLDNTSEALGPEETEQIKGIYEISSDKFQEIQQMPHSTLSTSSPDTFDDLQLVNSNPEIGCKSDLQELTPGIEDFSSEMSPESVQLSSIENETPVQTERTGLLKTKEDEKQGYDTTAERYSPTETQAEIQTEQEISVNVGVDSPVQDLQDTHQVCALKETQQTRDICEISSEETAESDDFQEIQQRFYNDNLCDLPPVMMSDPENVCQVDTQNTVSVKELDSVQHSSIEIKIPVQTVLEETYLHETEVEDHLGFMTVLENLSSSKSPDHIAQGLHDSDKVSPGQEAEQMRDNGDVYSVETAKSERFQEIQQTMSRPDNLVDLMPVMMSDPKRVCQRDSLEEEDLSSHKSPDSIEPSPTKDIPCPDSLESSPTDQRPDSKSPELLYQTNNDSPNIQDVDSLTENIKLELNNEITIQREAENQNEDNELPEIKQSVPLQPSLEGNDEDQEISEVKKQFTPEEKMFKMAAKIRVFDEIEKDTKMRKVRFDFTTSSQERGDELKEKEEEIQSCDRTPLYDEEEDTKQECGPESSTASYQHSVQHNDSPLTELPQDEPEQALSQISECTYSHEHRTSEVGEMEMEVLPMQIHIDKKQLSHEDFSPECLIIEDKDDTMMALAKDSDAVLMDNKPDSNSDTECDIINGKTVEMPQSVIDNVCPVNDGKATEEYLPQPYEEDHGGKSQGISELFQEELVPWSAELEENESFNSQIEAEELKIHSQSTDTRSQESTPEMPAAQTPTENGQPNPFLFQEGKLFEMTRGGAIDMSRRSTEEERDVFVFFPISEDPSEEIPCEQVRERETSQEVSIDSEKEDSPQDISGLLDDARDSESHSDSDSPKEKVLGFDSSIADVDTATSTVTRSIYSEQDMESSDSSGEDDQHSVIEILTPTHEALVHPSGETSQISSHSVLSSPKDPASELESRKSKSKIPVKANSFNHILGKGGSTEQNQRPKSEADIGLSDFISSVHSSSVKPMSHGSKIPVSVEHISSGALHSDQPQHTHEGSGAEKSPDEKSSPRTVLDGYRRSTHFQTPSVGDDIFETRPNWEDCVETQMQRLSDSSSPDQSKVDWNNDADRKEEILSIIADLLGFSWTELAKELEFNENEVQQVRAENPNSLQEQSTALLQRWTEREGKHATEDSLLKKLTKINRMDIVHLIKTQLNKSAQEQTSRTYAEIEKTLDHSEGSTPNSTMAKTKELSKDTRNKIVDLHQAGKTESAIAMSSVQEVSPRMVRKVDISQKPPAAVSEEDLSVASLLDIPSWAEPVGHAHSESIHGDMLEELEVTQTGLVGWTETGLVGWTKTGLVGWTKTGLVGWTKMGLVGWTKMGLVGWTKMGLVGWTKMGLVGWTETGILSAAGQDADQALSEPEDVLSLSPAAEAPKPYYFNFSQSSIDRFSCEISTNRQSNQAEVLTCMTEEHAEDHLGSPPDDLSPVYEKSDMEESEKSSSQSRLSGSEAYKSLQPTESDQGLGEELTHSVDQMVKRSAPEDWTQHTPDLTRTPSESDYVFVNPESDQLQAGEHAEFDSAGHYEENMEKEEPSEGWKEGSQIPEAETEAVSPEKSPQIIPSVQDAESPAESQEKRAFSELPDDQHFSTQLQKHDLQETHNIYTKDAEMQREVQVEEIISDCSILKQSVLQRDVSPLSHSDISPQTPDTVRATQHFDFGEVLGDSERTSAQFLTKIPETATSQISKRPQSESFMSDLPSQISEEASFSHSLSECDQTAVRSLSTDEALALLQKLVPTQNPLTDEGFTLELSQSRRSESEYETLTKPLPKADEPEIMEMQKDHAHVLQSAIRQPEKQEMFLTTSSYSELDLEQNLAQVNSDIMNIKAEEHGAERLSTSETGEEENQDSVQDGMEAPVTQEALAGSEEKEEPLRLRKSLLSHIYSEEAPSHGDGMDDAADDDEDHDDDLDDLRRFLARATF